MKTFSLAIAGLIACAGVASAQGFTGVVGTTPMGAAAPTNGSLAYSTVVVGTSSTAVLAAATGLRSKLYLVNASGRTGATTATSTDVWCVYGATAALNTGFALYGSGDRIFEDSAAMIDGRQLNCIAPTAVSIVAGVVQ